MNDVKMEIPRLTGAPIELILKEGTIVFIVGVNGSGKSALLHQFVLKNKNKNVKWMAAHRQTWLNSESLEITPAMRQQYDQQYLSYYTKNDARWKDTRAGHDLSAILFDLIAKDNSWARNIISYLADENYKEAKEIYAKSISPFEQINELLSLGTLRVKLENADDWSIRARHSQDESYSIAKMSDGERSAAIVAAQVITAKPGTVLLIDEPEKHLHRSIIQPFLSALFDLRRHDCAFIISTHEIALPVANPDARVIMLRSCQWNGSKCTAWDVKVLEPNSQLPEELKHAILGSREKVLFVEGDSDNSIDFPLYTALFPDISIIPKGSCDEVQKAVLGLRGSSDIHEVEAFGLIDRDDKNGKEVEELEKNEIFALKVYSAEALYYCSDAIAAVADEQAKLRQENVEKLIETAKKKALDVLKEHAEEMAAKRCIRKIQESTLSKMPHWKSIKDNPDQSFCISIDSQPYSEELNHFNKLVDEENLDQLIARYPVRQSCALETIARSLKCTNKRDYEKIFINLIRCDDELAEKLKKRIEPLSSRLNQIENSETI